MNTLFLWLIMAVAICLRFYNFADLPFTHDELSAIQRLNYESFHELISKGVKPDGHPAAIQVFLYYYTRLFGVSEEVVKLPFLLMGIASIYFTYRLAKVWTGIFPALMVTAFAATLQYHIFYSQIARPYISGYFFTVAMVYYWSGFLFSENIRYNQLAGFIFFALLCCYNHYFSHLLAIIAGISGIFFVKRKTVWPYLSAGVIIFLLYLPHMPVFLNQIKTGGIGGEGGWLEKPREDFLLQYLQYLFHYSPLNYSLVFLLLAAGIKVTIPDIAKYTGNGRSNGSFLSRHKFRILSLTWFLLPYFAGYYYSILINPVLQFSVLFFSFPFLLIFLFSFLKSSYNRFIRFSVLLLILAVNIFTLFQSRRHYELMYKQPFSQFAIHTREIAASREMKKINFCFGAAEDFIRYYFMAYGLPYAASWKLQPNEFPHALKKRLQNDQADYVICDNLPFEYLACIREAFPFLVKTDKGFTYEYYCFSKNPADSGNSIPDPTLFYLKTGFESPDNLFQYNSGLVQKDSAANGYYLMDDGIEWGPVCKLRLDSIAKSRHELIDISVAVKISGMSGKGTLVMILENEKGETVEWKGIDAEKFAASSGDWTFLYLTYRLSDKFKSDKEMKGLRLVTYYWNSGRKKTWLDNFSVRVKEGNPYMYGLYEDIR